MQRFKIVHYWFLNSSQVYNEKAQKYKDFAVFYAESENYRQTRLFSAKS